MTHGEEQERAERQMAEALAAPDALGRGDSRPPKYGEWLRGIWASEKNPQRDGRYVRTTRRTGRVNRGTFYELTDGRGGFWSYWADSTVYIKGPTEPQAIGYVPYCHTDGESCIVGEFRMDEFHELPFELADPEHWECRAVYIAPNGVGGAGVGTSNGETQ